MADGTPIIDPSRSGVANPQTVEISTNLITEAGSVAEGKSVQRVKIGIGEDGKYEDIHADNPLSVSSAFQLELVGLLCDLVNETRLTNLYLSRLVGEELTTEDIEKEN